MTEREMLHLNQALADLARAYKEDWTDERLKAIYCRVLGDAPLDDLLAACSQWLASDTPYFPKPGQLRTLALNLPHRPTSSVALKNRAEEAWLNLRANASDRYNRWALQDAITHQVFRMMGGGYTTAAGFGQWDAKYEEVRHREFVDMYLELAKRHDDLLALPTGGPANTFGTQPEIAAPVGDNYAEFVKGMITQVQDRLSLTPEGVPARYMVDRDAAKSLTYRPSMTPEELEVQRARLLRQTQAVMVQELVRKQYSPPYQVPTESDYIPEQEAPHVPSEI